MAGVAQYTTLQTVDGQNIVPFFENKNKRDDKKILLWHYPNNWTNVNFKGTSWGSAMRQGDWKLVYLHKTQTLELYNLKEDIGELNDLAKTQPAKLKQMARLFTDELKKRNAHLPTFKATGQTIPYPDGVK